MSRSAHTLRSWTNASCIGFVDPSLSCVDEAFKHLVVVTRYLVNFLSIYSDTYTVCSVLRQVKVPCGARLFLPPQYRDLTEGKVIALFACDPVCSDVMELCSSEAQFGACFWRAVQDLVTFLRSFWDHVVASLW